MDIEMDIQFLPFNMWWNLRDSGDRWSDDYLPDWSEFSQTSDLICSKWAKLEKRAKMFLPHPRVKEEMCVSVVRVGPLKVEHVEPHFMGTVSPVGNSSLKSGLPPWPWGVLFTGPPCSRSFADSWVRIHVLLSFVRIVGRDTPTPTRTLGAKYMMVLRRWCYVNENFKTLKWKYSTI